MKVYIAGPMSGYPEFNFPAFFAAEKKLTDDGWTVFNPANKDSETSVTKHESYANGDAIKLVSSGWDFRDAYSWDADRVIEADAIYLLPGWEHSPGARGEWGLAVVMQTKYPGKYFIYYGDGDYERNRPERSQIIGAGR